MAGLFMFLGFPRGLLELLGFDLGSQSWLPSLPAESHLGFHLGFHLGSLCFRLSSTWDSILGVLGFDLGVPTRPGSSKVFLSTSDTQIVQT